LSEGRQEKFTTARPQAPSLQSESSAHELPEAVKNLIEARTGDAVYVVGPDYRIVYWDSRWSRSPGCSPRSLCKSLVTKPSWANVRTANLSAPMVAR
jgi:hypothetical protein